MFSSRTRYFLRVMDTTLVFPEADWPCQVDCQSYRERTKIGAARLRKLRLVITGLAGPTVYTTWHFKLLNDLSYSAYDCRIALSDGLLPAATKKIWKGWLEEHPRGVFLEAPRTGTKPSRLLASWESCIHYAKDLSLSRSIDYVVLLDLGYTLSWSWAGLQESFAHPKWDCMGSKPVRAERRPGWCEGTYAPSAVADSLRGSRPIFMNSCFGGLSIFPIEVFTKGTFSGPHENPHRNFHESLSSVAPLRYVNPGQLVLTT